MRNTFVILLAISLFGCTKNELSEIGGTGLFEDLCIEIDNETRNYHLYVPPNSNFSPIVLLFHGNRSNNNELIGLTNARAPYNVWLEIAEEENIIIAIPNGNEGVSNQRGWNDCREDASSNPESNDVLFISTLLDTLIDNFRADANRVYTMGTSNGGHFSIRLAEELSDKITAFAAVAASNPANSHCINSATPISAMFINGTMDPILPFEGGEIDSDRGEVISTDETIAYWVAKNQTEVTPEITMFIDRDTDDNCTVESFLYSNGISNTEVVLYRVNDGGHTEPSIQERYSNIFKEIVGDQNGDIEIADEVWEFFRDKSK